MDVYAMFNVIPSYDNISTNLTGVSAGVLLTVFMDCDGYTVGG